MLEFYRVLMPSIVFIGAEYELCCVIIFESVWLEVYVRKEYNNIMLSDYIYPVGVDCAFEVFMKKILF